MSIDRDVSFEELSRGFELGTDTAIISGFSLNLSAFVLVKYNSLLNLQNCIINKNTPIEIFLFVTTYMLKTYINVVFPLNPT